MILSFCDSHLLPQCDLKKGIIIIVGEVVCGSKAD